ncbi:hypothetical protein [Deinococcus hohokamensis]|uniref:Uncharacterized protein n=1 Tax=Deinococcus hohokamensis TaxID=309883 RepID=A0ABV9I823_9DEIO
MQRQDAFRSAVRWRGPVITGQVTLRAPLYTDRNVPLATADRPLPLGLWPTSVKVTEQAGTLTVSP